MAFRFRLVDQLKLEADSIEIRPGGAHCDVAIVTRDTTNHFIKVIGGKKGRMTKAEAETIAADINTYQEKLDSIGVPVPLESELQILFDDEENDYKILHIAPYVGHDADFWLRKDIRVVKDTLDYLVEPVRCVISQTIHGTELNVGFDPKPANFARLRSGARFWYVDMMPPRFRDGNKVLTEYPEPNTASGKRLAYFRFFDQRGVLHVLFVHLCRIRPLQRPFFFKTVIKLAEEVGVANYFLESPAAEFAREKTGRRMAIVHGLESKDLYWLRDIACHLAWEHKLTPAELEQFFLTTHFNDGLPANALEVTKMVLSKAIKS